MPISGFPDKSFRSVCSVRQSIKGVPVLLAFLGAFLTHPHVLQGQTPAIPVIVSSHEAADGDTIDVQVSADLSGVGKSIGSFQGRLAYDPSLLSYVSAGPGEFSGTFDFNADSVDLGILNVAGINTSDGVNMGVTTILEVRFVVSGNWGQTSTIDLTLNELIATDFSPLTGAVIVTPGEVMLNPGPFRILIDPDSATISTTESTPLVLRALMDSTLAQIGSFSGRIEIDGSVAVVDSIRAASFGGVITSNLEMLADSGFVRFAGANANPPTADTLDLFAIYVRGVGDPGTETILTPHFDELSDAVQISDLTPFVSIINPGTLLVYSGYWGDPNDDEVTTALDALICLSHVVGKDLPEGFDPAACDVAPDDGESFTGKVTAMDALAILSYVVGKNLPEYFRVGVLR